MKKFSACRILKITRFMIFLKKNQKKKISFSWILVTNSMKNPRKSPRNSVYIGQWFFRTGSKNQRNSKKIKFSKISCKMQKLLWPTKNSRIKSTRWKIGRKIGLWIEALESRSEKITRNSVYIGQWFFRTGSKNQRKSKKIKFSKISCYLQKLLWPTKNSRIKSTRWKIGRKIGLGNSPVQNSLIKMVKKNDTFWIIIIQYDTQLL